MYYIHTMQQRLSSNFVSIGQMYRSHTSTYHWIFCFGGYWLYWIRLRTFIIFCQKLTIDFHEISQNLMKICDINPHKNHHWWKALTGLDRESAHPLQLHAVKWSCCTAANIGHTSNLWGKCPLYGSNATGGLISQEIHYQPFVKKGPN